MKPHSKTNIGNKRESDSMSARRSSTLAVGGEVSLSFQDELAATIHGAFEVAVEIAVLEVTKLVGQALGDVRDQMHETQRENKSLKLRLQSAEQELDSVRGCADNASQQQLATVNQPGRQTPSPQNNDRMKSEKQTKDSKAQAKSPLNTALEETYEYLMIQAETSCEGLKASFSEICEDGRVCSHDLNPTSSGESVPHHDPVKEPKQDSPSPYPENQASDDSIDHAGPGTEPGDEGPSSLRLKVERVSSPLHPTVEPGPSSLHPEAEPVRVKEERAELDEGSGSGSGSGSSSGCSFDSVEDEGFGPDRLSLAQSRMLEEWRPNPLHLQSCGADALGQGPSHAQAHVQSDAPDLSSSSTGGLPDFPASFSGLYQSGDTAPLSHLSPQHYGVQIRTNFPSGNASHVCKLCGQSFHRAADLRRHHGQHHRAKPAAATKTPKRQMFPPGRSPYHCSECGRDFNRMENLKTHLRIHTGERPYACSVCGVRFRHSGALTRHFRIHTGEKPYVCAQCGKSFRNCGGLRFHQRSHGRENPLMAGQLQGFDPLCP